MASLPRPLPLTAASAAVLTVAALALAGCSSPGGPAASATSSAATSAPAASAPASGATAPAAQPGQPAKAPPSGYQWVGIAAQKLWLAVPASWVVLNLNSMSVTQAMERVRIKGQPASAMRTDLEGLKRNHAIVVMDLASIRTSPRKFSSNVNAFCAPASVEPGAGAATALISQARSDYAQMGAHVVAVRKLTVTAASVVVRFQIRLQSTAGYAIDELQYAQLSRRGRICYATFSTDRPAAFFPIFHKVATTIRLG